MRELELLGERDSRGFLSNTLNTIKKSVEVAKRHLELEKRNTEENRILRSVAENFKKAAESHKQKRDFEQATDIYKRFSGLGLGMAPQLLEHAKRKEEQEREIRRAAGNIKTAAETFKRRRDAEASKRACGAGLGFCTPEMEEKKRAEDQEREVLRRAAENIKRVAEIVKRKRDAEASRRACGVGLGFCTPEMEEKKRNDDQEKVLLKTAENIKRAAEAIMSIKRKRDREASKRACGTGLGFCTPEMEQKKREEDNKVLRSVAENIRKVIDTVKHKRSEDGFLSNAMNALTKSTEIAKRHTELKKRSEDEKRALQDVAKKLEKAVDEMKHKRQDEEDVKRESVGFLTNTMNAIKKSAEMAKRHVEQEKRNNENKRALYDLAESLKKRACGVGLGFCGPEPKEKSRRNPEGGVGKALSEFQNRHVEDEGTEEEDERKRKFRSIAESFRKAADAVNKKRGHIEMRKREEQSRVFRDVAEQIRKAASSIKDRREQNEVESPKSRRWCTQEGYCTDKKTKRAVENVSDAFKKIATRHINFGKGEEESRAFRDVAEQIEKATSSVTQRREQSKREVEDNMKVLRNVANNIKQAVDNIKQQKRDQAKRVCGTGLGICSPEEEEKAKRNGGENFENLLDEIMKRATEEKKREEVARLSRRQPVASSLSAIKGVDETMAKKSTTSEEDWKRDVREVLDNKAAQIRATMKRFPPFRAAVPGQV